MRRRVGLLLALPFFAMAATIVGAQAPQPAAVEPPRVARFVPRPGGPADRRGGQQHVRLGSPVGPDRHDRQPPQRHAGARSRDPVGGRRDESGRPRERAHRARDGAQVGARRTRARRSSSRLDIRWSCSALATASARPARRRPGRGARRPHLRRARREGFVGARAHRAVQRAVHQLRRDGPLPGRGAVARRAPRRRRHAGALGRTAWPARRIPARCSTRPTSRRSPPPRSRPRTPIACSAWPTAAAGSSSA